MNKKVYIENVALPLNSSYHTGGKVSFYYKNPEGTTSNFLWFDNLPYTMPGAFVLGPINTLSTSKITSITPTPVSKDQKDTGRLDPDGNYRISFLVNGLALNGFNTHYPPDAVLYPDSIGAFTPENRHLVQSAGAWGIDSGGAVARFDFTGPQPEAGSYKFVLYPTSMGSDVASNGCLVKDVTVYTIPSPPNLLSMTPTSNTGGAIVSRIDFEIENYVAGGKICVVNYGVSTLAVTEYTPIEIISSVEPPTNLTVVSSVAQDAFTCTVTLTADKSVSPNTNTYKIWYNNNSAPTLLSNTIVVSGAGPCTWQLPLSLNKIYSFYAVAINDSAVESAATPIITFDTTVSVVANPPSVPLSVIAVVGSSPNSVKVTWSAPTTPNGTLDTYVVTNKQTGDAINVSPSGTLEAVDTGLSYDTAYTFGVKARNTATTTFSTEAISNLITLTAPVTAPSPPTNLKVSASTGVGRINWELPVSEGSSAIIGYRVVLNNNSGFAPLTELVNASTFEKIFNGLVSGVKYYFTVEAQNSSGFGAPSVSITFDTAMNNYGGDVVKYSYNYRKFYEAPVVLDKNSSNYNEYIYPETVVNPIHALIINNNLSIPISFSTTNNAIGIRSRTPDQIGEDTLSFITLDSLTYTSFIELVDELQAKVYNAPTPGYPFEVTSVSNTIGDVTVNTLIIRATVFTSKFELTYEMPRIGSITYNNVNDIIFGKVPSYSTPYNEYLVQGHVPTPVYDNSNYKALVESKPISTVKNLEVVYKPTGEQRPFPYLEVDHNDLILNTNRYKIRTQNTALRPNKVDISWYNVNNTYTHIVDYEGDGVLLEKVQGTDLFGNVIYTYEPADKVLGYGTVDYRNGIISNLYLKGYRPASILGQGVKFPVLVYKTANLVLNYKGSLINIPITGGPGVSYTAEQLVNYLNNSGVLNTSNFSFTAVYVNSQLFLYNNRIGPEETLTIDGAPAGSLTLSLFGTKPIQIAPPKIYISYSFSLNQENKNNYIWYQTPHFLVRVTDRLNSALFTNVHLNYILEKIKVLRPATSVFKGVSLTSNLEDEAQVYETYENKTYDATAIPLPYIIVAINPSALEAIPPSSALGTVTIVVTNPDGQEDALVNGYTYNY